MRELWRVAAQRGATVESMSRLGVARQQEEGDGSDRWCHGPTHWQGRESGIGVKGV